LSDMDVAAWLVPLESGLKKKHIIKVLALLPEDAEIIPFEIHEDNSSAYGFATVETVDQENGLESIVDLLGSVIDDWPSESSEYTGVSPSGKKVYIGCDFRTMVFKMPEELN